MRYSIKLLNTVPARFAVIGAEYSALALARRKDGIHFQMSKTCPAVGLFWPVGNAVPTRHGFGRIWYNPKFLFLPGMIWRAAMFCLKKPRINDVVNRTRRRNVFILTFSLNIIETL